jgi:predicted transcriptional regulator
MSTTTIRLPEELKERVARAAERAGTTSHAFILDAIAARVDEDARRDDSHAAAERRYPEIVATGRTIPWREMRTCLDNRLSGDKPPRPRARKLAR